MIDEHLKSWIIKGCLALLGFILFLGSWFTIDQTEMGNIRRFGTRVYSEPLRPGLHFKIPLIDTVAKNAAVAAENQKRTRQFEADQVVITATGAANAVRAKAEGDAYAVKIAADAEQYRLIAESKGLIQRVQAFGSAAAYNDWIRAQAWKGEVPSYVGTGTPIPFLPLK